MRENQIDVKEYWDCTKNYSGLYWNVNKKSISLSQNYVEFKAKFWRNANGALTSERSINWKLTYCIKYSKENWIY